LVATEGWHLWLVHQLVIMIESHQLSLISITFLLSSSR
jgi:hypothetical protein